MQQGALGRSRSSCGVVNESFMDMDTRSWSYVLRIEEGHARTPCGKGLRTCSLFVHSTRIVNTGGFVLFLLEASEHTSASLTTSGR